MRHVHYQQKVGVVFFSNMCCHVWPTDNNIKKHDICKFWKKIPEEYWFQKRSPSNLLDDDFWWWSWWILSNPWYCTVSFWPGALKPIFFWMDGNGESHPFVHVSHDLVRHSNDSHPTILICVCFKFQVSYVFGMCQMYWDVLLVLVSLDLFRPNIWSESK